MKGDLMEIFMMDKISPYPSFPKRGIGKKSFFQGVYTRTSAVTHRVSLITHYSLLITCY